MATTDGGVVALLKVLDVIKFSLFCVVLALGLFIFRSARYASRPLIPVEANIKIPLR